MRRRPPWWCGCGSYQTVVGGVYHIYLHTDDSSFGRAAPADGRRDAMANGEVVDFVYLLGSAYQSEV